MNVSRQFLPPRVVLYRKGAKPPLEQMPVTPMPAIKPHPIADVEPMHRPAQVGLRCLQQQVVMVVHQHVGVHPDPKTFAQFAQQFQDSGNGPPSSRKISLRSFPRAVT